MRTANIRIIRGRTSLPVIFVEKMGSTERNRGHQVAVEFHDDECARRGGGAPGAPGEVRRPLARIMRAQQLSIFLPSPLHSSCANGCVLVISV